jgi:glycosyltransferase involved in cell wall biosynthesis
VDSLAGGVRRVLHMSAEERAAMGERAMARARRLFSKESLQDSTMKVYATVLGERV